MLWAIADTSPLRVAIDATALLEPRTGVGRVTAAIVHGLAAVDGIAVTAFAISGRRGRRLPDRLPDGVTAATVPLPARLVRPLWRHVDLPTVDRFIGPAEVVHGPNFVVPPTRAARLATVHDLTPLRFPHLANPWTLAYPDLVRRTVEADGWIHTVSEAVRREVLEHFDIDADRVVAVPNGFDPIQGDATRGRRLARVTRYVLAVGTIEPRKDLPTLLRAIDRLADDDDDEICLVHAGPDGWGIDDFDRGRAQLRHPDRIRRLGRVGDRALEDLYAGATVFAFPSIYEGFGLPVLEAMSASVPVVATDVAAVREVAGDAAVLVPIGDDEALATEIGRCWSDSGVRESLVERGAARAAAFTWEATISGLTDLYHRIAA